MVVKQDILEKGGLHLFLDRGSERIQMVLYKNLRGNSGVLAYEILEDRIILLFKGTARTYSYSYSKAGRFHVDNMKKMAKAGHGLNSYVNRYVRFLYD